VPNSIKVGGNGTIKYNVFCQPTEPSTKHGIWLKTAAVEAIKKIVFDTQPFAAGSWLADQGITLPNRNLYCHATCVIGQYIYIFSGLAGSSNPAQYNYKFDTVARTFTELPGLPVSLSDVNILTQMDAFVVNGKIYLFGSYLPVYMYDPVLNTFMAKASRPGSANYRACALLGDKVYEFLQDKSVYIYTISSNTWAGSTAITVPNTGANHGVSFTYNNKIYINDFYGGLIIYNPVDKTFTLGASSPINAGDACFWVGDEVYFLNSYGSPTHNMAAYKPGTNTWRLLPDHPIPQGGIVIGNAVGNMIYVFQFWYNCKMAVYSLTAKQYPDTPTAVIQYLSGDASHVASLIASKLCDYLPSYFKDAMLFKDGNLLYPELWLGNGTAWTKIREAQS
jgi:hypothetical protein